jgi:hypothetical protein
MNDQDRNAHSARPRRNRIGGARLDQFGQPTREGGSALVGQPAQWLGLVARGYVAGEHGKIILTQQAREELQGRSG